MSLLVNPASVQLAPSQARDLAPGLCKFLPARVSYLMTLSSQNPCRAWLFRAAAMLALLAGSAPSRAVRAQSGGVPGALPHMTSEADFERYFHEITRADDRRRCVNATAGGRVLGRVAKPDSSTPAVVRGDVLGLATRPIVGALVQIAGTSTVVRTDAQGLFSITIPASQLKFAPGLTASAEGYSNQSMILWLTPGDSSDVTFLLCPATAVDTPQVVPTQTQVRETSTPGAAVVEGDSVVIVGKTIVALRRGRLISITTGGHELRVVSTIPSFGDAADAKDIWPAMLFAHGAEIIAVGDRRERAGIVIGRFHLEPAGTLTYRGSFEITAPDYSPSIATRAWLVGGRLVFYVPVALPWATVHPLAALPQLKRWISGQDAAATTALFEPERIFHLSYNWDGGAAPIAHTLITCDLARAALSCGGSVTIGARPVQFFITPRALFVWSRGYHFPFGFDTSPDSGQAMLLRIPLNGAPPAALAVEGQPVDQHSLVESDDGYVNVMVRGDSGTPVNISGPQVGRAMKLLRAPLQYFGASYEIVPSWRYRPLPAPPSEYLTDRFVGDYLLYTSTYTGGTTLIAVPWRGGEITSLEVPFYVSYIQAIGPNAIVQSWGTNGLTRWKISAHGALGARADSVHTELSSLFGPTLAWKSGDASVVVAFSERSSGDPGYRSPMDGFTSAIFFRETANGLSILGRLRGHADTTTRQGCIPRCEGAAGNARPLFVGGEFFSLWGDQLIEGRLRAGKIVEVRRIDIAPH